MRARKRTEWPLRVYKYSIRPEHDTWDCLPAEAKEEIEKTHVLWNSLVEAFERRQTRYREILAHTSLTAEKPQKPTTRSALALLQRSFLDETRRLTAQNSATWANREFVLTQFLAAVQRFFKKQGKAPKSKHGPPTSVHFHHRFTGGGTPIAGIFGRSQRLRLDQLPPNVCDSHLSQRQRKRLARTTGAFQVGNTVLPFQLLLHRPLPEAAFVKTAALIGRQILREGYLLSREGGHSLPSRWSWSLQLTLEQPPQAQLSQSQKIAEGTLVLSRQVWGEEQVQIGVLVDSTGREEALLLPERILLARRYKQELQSCVDSACAETKTRLRELSRRGELSAEVQRLLAHVSKVRTPGLWRLLQLAPVTREDGEVTEILCSWADRVTRLMREARGLERRYLGHRNWFYRNLALQLCQRYQRLVVIPHVPPPMPAQRPDRDPLALQRDNTYRQLVSPSVFLAFLKEAAAKTGTRLEER